MIYSSLVEYSEIFRPKTRAKKVARAARVREEIFKLAYFERIFQNQFNLAVVEILRVVV